MFRFIKGYARLAIKIYCRKIIINNPEWLNAKGPLLVASNHPNSFLDGIILTTLFKEDLYSLARGDAFRNKKHEKILRWLHLLPVYRTSEGLNNLEHNYTTFDTCKLLFEQQGIVMIFSEGRCINEWHLRPLKKGTARLAIRSWQEGIDVTVVPVGFNYSLFRNFGKNVFINFGQPLNKKEILQKDSEGKMFLSFNEQLNARLKLLVEEISFNDKKKLRENLFVAQTFLKKVLLALPALVGFVLHAPLYFPAKAINLKYFDNDHFDSTLVGILMLAYPIYLLLFSIAAAISFGWLVALLVWIIFPFTAWACVQLKPQLP
ncbi:MAG: 1-acyl-sn-glycerol-3-phosphate acyltransferase [Bacteroidota bacterium]|nr:1-acyl-sn-glycerol-3-phosphate acyltransferase [Bacteroidota bacterium]